ncbi:bacillithiol biosynthesis cysteine-adding enzyme BshC [Niabella sp. CC-SYL272]|uniref:bacillithiol biosynthesis cysteine-adding enzyme BshC n=1 Tax=Niabella agricola TaxID=2891571 RepID=UPI001F18BE5E|nr:bacillithiol biosynthesis cysteine-adding enzyme BshC [Niabella agricola]MCF3108690.1 bacillithiol biosynthesis cysteine-adding enzyme BshC [Niabella agricola]
MDCKTQHLSYAETGFFGKLVLDYLNEDAQLKPFYGEFPSAAAIGDAIGRRKAVATNRALLVRALRHQYRSVPASDQVNAHLALLEKETTFTTVTAHQPNIFTGPLYFIYKILHAIQLAAQSKKLYPEYDFVPVYYMGSEDADLDELGHFFVDGQKRVWDTDQTGAVGRMKVDKALLELINGIEAQIGVLPYGSEIAHALRSCYQPGVSIQEATFAFVHFLFAGYGLIVVIPDNAELKSIAAGLFKDELQNGRSAAMVETTAAQLTAAGYKVQAHSREINLFYLTDQGRHRIERSGDRWNVVDTAHSFSQAEMIKEVDEHPERFSPNVILRPVFQEMILPNLLFVGGGGELAYWIQLKKIFEYYGVPYPLLVLRNSFLLINRKQAALVQKLGYRPLQLFQSPHDLKNDWIRVHSGQKLDVTAALDNIRHLYSNLKAQAAPVDGTLLQHITALETHTTKRITELGKKMLRAEKRNHQDAMNQVTKLKAQLFPLNNLQERIENFIPFYAQYGRALIDTLYQHSLGLEQEFVVLEAL